MKLWYVIKCTHAIIAFEIEKKLFDVYVLVFLFHVHFDYYLENIFQDTWKLSKSSTIVMGIMQLHTTKVISKILFLKYYCDGLFLKPHARAICPI